MKIMSEKDNHLSFDTRNSGDSFTEKAEKTIDSLKPEQRKEGQSIRDYIQNEGSHTGLIGAITGTIIAVASFVADVVGSVARNLLWSQQMQEAISDRMRRTSPRKTADITNEKETNEDGKTAEQKKEEPVNVQAILKAYGIESTIISDTVCLKGCEDKVLSPEEYADPEKVEDVLSLVKGSSIRTSIEAAMIAAAYQSKKDPDFNVLEHDIPTKRGNIHLQLKKIDDGFVKVQMNEEDILQKLPQDVIIRPELFEIIKKDTLFMDYMENAAKEILSKEHEIAKDFSISVDPEQKVTIKEKENVIYEGLADIERLEKVFTEHPIEEIGAKAAAVAVACSVTPEQINKQYDHKNIFTNEEYPEGHSHISIAQNCIYLHEPKPERLDRDLGICTGQIDSDRSISKITSTLQISKEDAKRAKSLDFEETILVKADGKDAFLINHEEEGLSVYVPDKMPEVIRKRAIDPYLREHTDKLPALVEKDGKIFTALNKEGEGVIYDSASINEEMLLTKLTEIPRLSPDEITPEFFADFADRLEKIYEQSAKNMDIGKEILNDEPEFYYVKEESDSENKDDVEAEKTEDKSEEKTEDRDENVPFPEEESSESMGSDQDTWQEEPGEEPEIDYSKYDQPIDWGYDEYEI